MHARGHCSCCGGQNTCEPTAACNTIIRHLHWGQNNPYPSIDTLRTLPAGLWAQEHSITKQRHVHTRSLLNRQQAAQGNPQGCSAAAGLLHNTGARQARSIVHTVFIVAGYAPHPHKQSGGHVKHGPRTVLQIQCESKCWSMSCCPGSDTHRTLPPFHPAAKPRAGLPSLHYVVPCIQGNARGLPLPRAKPQLQPEFNKAHATPSPLANAAAQPQGNPACCGHIERQQEHAQAQLPAALPQCSRCTAQCCA